MNPLFVTNEDAGVEDTITYVPFVYCLRYAKKYGLKPISGDKFDQFAQIFLPNGPHKTTFGIFEILKIEILTNFIRFR